MTPAARADRLISGFKSGEHSLGLLLARLELEIVDAITAAVLEERERCAKVAEDAARNYRGSSSLYPSFLACERVVAAIREPVSPPPPSSESGAGSVVR